MPLNRKALKELREKRGLTQTEAATRAGWPFQKWSDYETGSRTDNPELATLEAMAKVLQCSVTRLVTTR